MQVNAQPRGCRVDLVPRKKWRSNDRSVSLEETLSRVQRHINPFTGPVLRVEAAASGPSGFVYTAYHGFAGENTAQAISWDETAKTYGKGQTADEARTSAVCEALERHSGLFCGDEPVLRSSLQQLGDSAIHPNVCMNFSARQYAEREQWNQRQSQFNWVPLPLDETRVIDWTPLWSLTKERVRYLPTAYCYYGSPALQADFCRADSNGCAAGNNLEEAILAGFLEIVERDGVAIWWYSRAPRPGVNLDSFAQPYFRVVEEACRATGRKLWVLDLTSDLHIPTFAAVSRGDHAGKHDYAFGFGAHLDAARAIAKALAEMVQALALTRAPRRFWVGGPLQEAFLKPAGDCRAVADFASASCDDLREDVQECVRRAQALGMETLVLDQTRSHVGLSVVRVVVPGMRKVWARFGPGRLYDVPLALGWVARRLAENKLNPAHLCV